MQIYAQPKRIRVIAYCSKILILHYILFCSQYGYLMALDFCLSVKSLVCRQTAVNESSLEA